MKRIIICVVAALMAVMSVMADNALVCISVANVREKPSHASELVTQQLMGMPVELLSKDGEWWKVKTIDGYEGYIIGNSLTQLSSKQYDAWRRSSRVVYVGDLETRIFDGDDGLSVSDVVPGCILQSEGTFDGLTALRLPDGREGFLATSLLMPLEQWASQPFSPDKILNYARNLIGTPYLWGGLSVKGLDCSGLTWSAFWLNGRLLQRDASKQARMSVPTVDSYADVRPCDLVFFGNPANGRINHVGMIECDGKTYNSVGTLLPTLLHSSGRVKRNEINPSRHDYFTDKLVTIKRFSYVPAIANTPAASWLFLK